MGTITRFYDRVSGQDGPVSGALQVLPLVFHTALATNTASSQQIHLPAGMQFEVTDVEIFCGVVVAEASATVGSSAAGAEVVAATGLATGANVLTIAEGSIAAGGFIDVTITNDTTGSVALPLYVSVVGYASAPPTSVKNRID